MFYETLILFVVVIASAAVEGYITCGSSTSTGTTQCYGAGAYCCGMFNDECCWDSVYTFWWFWFIWFMVVVFIISCSICICVRRRRRYAAQPRYVIVDGNQATYGTMPQGYRYPPNSAGYQYTSVPTMPATAPAYQEKPPDYNTAIAN